MKIDDMPAGKEMNELIATKILGWVRGDDVYWINPSMALYREFTYDGGDYDFEDFMPSEYIDHAWIVVEKMKDWESADGRRFGRIELTWDVDAWQAAFGYWGTATATGMATTDTPQLAICRAALKAVGITEV
jgi:hypothetical protein